MLIKTNGGNLSVFKISLAYREKNSFRQLKRRERMILRDGQSVIFTEFMKMCTFCNVMISLFLLPSTYMFSPLLNAFKEL